MAPETHGAPAGRHRQERRRSSRIGSVSVRQAAPLDNFLEKQGFLMLDGGLATELEESGHDLDHPLWSARLLIENPDAIYQVHRAYLDAGADCIITASYQASVPGLEAQGLSKKEAESTIARSVTLACQARDDFLSDLGNKDTSRFQPLVAAGIGPYGAFLADGSEYRGNYGISEGDLRAFHERRWHILVESPADLFACETIPSLPEAKVLKSLLRDTPDVRGWISFSCRDGKHICDGTRLAECAALFDEDEQIVAIGVNCTAPRYIASLIDQVRRGAPTKRIVVYPNSGETYDAENRVWTGVSDPSDFGEAAVDWFKCGASLIGGCCRTGPHHIRAMRAAMMQQNRSEV
ncbi:MAG: homocysteine S-methyltransferase [Planctomycetes bacterium]|nr:homocysteine S-methyltransferase [Planctomycetota bacterium]